MKLSYAQKRLKLRLSLIILLITGCGGFHVTNAQQQRQMAVHAVTTRHQTREGEILRLQSIAVGKHPGPVAVGEGAVWIGTADKSGFVLKIDPQTQQIVAAIPVGKWPYDMSIGFGSVWVTSAYHGTLSRIDPHENRVVVTIPSGTLSGIGVRSLVIGEHGVWVTSFKYKLLVGSFSQVSEIDPRNNQIVQTITLGDNIQYHPSDIAYGDGSVWVSHFPLGPGFLPSTISRIDPKTGKIIAIPLGARADRLAFGEGAIWTVNNLVGSVSRIDPKTNQVVATIPVGKHPFAIAVGGGAVWVADTKDKTISRIDPKKNQVIDTIRVGKSPFPGLTYAEGTVWFTSDEDAVNRTYPKDVHTSEGQD